LDASAVLAVLHAEQGSQIVAAVLDDAVLSAVNYAEVISKLVERGMSRAQARAAVRSVDLQIVDFDEALAERTGEMRAATRQFGLSLADRACLALAEREMIPAFTSDRVWLGSIPGVEVRVIR
jgi:PIN domain nuclease of toxin-antitoxin system